MPATLALRIWGGVGAIICIVGIGLPTFAIVTWQPIDVAPTAYMTTAVLVLVLGCAVIIATTLRFDLKSRQRR